MGPLFALAILLLTTWAVIYLLMRLVCWLKKEYCLAETWLCSVIEYFECESCKKSCDDHRRMIRRAFLFAAVITAVISLTYLLVR